MRDDGERGLEPCHDQCMHVIRLQSGTMGVGASTARPLSSKQNFPLKQNPQKRKSDQNDLERIHT